MSRIRVTRPLFTTFALACAVSAACAPAQEAPAASPQGPAAQAAPAPAGGTAQPTPGPAASRPGQAGAPTAAPAMDASRAVTNGGVFVQGWQGRVDANEARAGLTLQNARFAMEGNAIRVTTGPASTYWNPANRATGNYTVRATFREAEYMGLNSHPHPYGIVIGGNDMGTEQQSFLYCAAYGNGNFIVRGFGPASFQMNGRGEANAAVNRAPAQGQPVQQEIAVRVTATDVQCIINGTTVATYPKADVVTAGRLRSTDGVYGVRFAHNTEATVTGLTMTPN